MNKIWVVEMSEPPTVVDRVWEPTVGVGLTREDARKEAQEWSIRNPTHAFRVRPYFRQKRD